MDAPVVVSIESLAHGGDAVGRAADGRTVFVSGACPGDTVAARITSDKGRYLTAETVEVISASPDRVEAPCPYFGTCGGCQWQHVAYPAQLAAKARIVSDAIERIGHADPACLRPPVAAVDPYGYRNKVELAVAADERGRVTAGFSARHGTSLVPVDACLLLPKRVAKAPKALSGALRFLSRGADLGVFRASLRTSAAFPDVEVAVWTPPSGFPRQAAAKVLAEATGATGVMRVIYKGTLKERTVVRTEVLSGRGYWRERLGEEEFAVSAPSFFQVNTATATLLADLVMGAARADGSDRVLDLYAGVGTFTLPLARAAGEVVAVEAASHAVRDLRRNLESALLDAEVAPGDAAMVLPGLGDFDTVVVDPPRTGLQPAALSAIIAAGPRRIVYVSCDPATLARDVAGLTEAGFSLVEATPVDLFPQTYHVECVAVLEAV